MSHLQIVKKDCPETVGVIDETLNNLQQDDPRLRLNDFLRLSCLANNLRTTMD